MQSKSHQKNVLFVFVFVKKGCCHDFDLLTLKMPINHQNNTINVFSSHNPMKRGITHAIALFCNNHIFAYLTLKMTFALEENIESWK